VRSKVISGTLSVLKYRGERTSPSRPSLLVSILRVRMTMFTVPCSRFSLRVTTVPDHSVNWPRTRRVSGR
jgi:hypothetical protein